jgi:hypothetical protein
MDGISGVQSSGLETLHLCAAVGTLLVVVLLLHLSSAMDDGEFDNGGGGGGGGGPVVAVAGGGGGGGGGGGVKWRWQRSTASMDYGETMARGRWHSTVAVPVGDGD